jgi:hypothetical protein
MPSLHRSLLLERKRRLQVPLGDKNGTLDVQGEAGMLLVSLSWLALHWGLNFEVVVELGGSVGNSGPAGSCSRWFNRVDRGMTISGVFLPPDGSGVSGFQGMLARWCGEITVASGNNSCMVYAKICVAGSDGTRSETLRGRTAAGRHSHDAVGTSWQTAVAIQSAIWRTLRGWQAGQR